MLCQAPSKASLSAALYLPLVRPVSATLFFALTHRRSASNKCPDAQAGQEGRGIDSHDHGSGSAYIIMGLSQIINEKVGLGRFQLQAFLILTLVDMNDGVELVLSSFLNPIIKAVFPGTTDSFIAALTSLFYLGILLGSLSSGLLADRYGRRRLIRHGALMQVGVAGMFYLVDSLALMALFRFFYGFSFGFTIAVTTSMFAEITPSEYRGKGILLINFCISIGKLYGVVLGLLFIKVDIEETNWKLMMVTGSLPNLLVLAGSYLVLKESPRHLLAHQRFDEGLEVLNFMISTNKGHRAAAVSREEAAELRRQFSADGDKYTSYKVLFNKANLAKTVAISTCWFVISYTFYGQLTIEALHISGAKVPLRQGLHKYFFTVFGELPSLLVTLFMIDHRSCGRRNSLMVFFAGAVLFHLGFALTALTIIGSIARFFMKDVFSILYPLTTESFETVIRTKGFGLCSGIGRLGAIIMPFVVIPLDNWAPASVYVSFALLSSLAFFAVWAGIQETMYRSLDRVEDEGVLMGVSQP